MTSQTYLHTDIYDHMADRLEAIARDHDPADLDLRFLIINALGEIGGIWPISCFTGQHEGEAVLIAASPY
jgi:hypothetical protein